MPPPPAPPSEYNPAQRFAAGLAWRWEKISFAVRAQFVRRSATAYIRWRWPWPMRKPFERAVLRLYSLGGGVGDELMCTPIFREIRRRNPKCRLTFVSRHPEMFRANPNLDAVEAYSPAAIRDAVQITYFPVLPPPRPLLTLMAECVGLNLRADRLDPPDVTPSPEVREKLAAIPGPRVIIQPGASAWTPNKKWPTESWRELVRMLVERFEVIEVGTEALFPGHDFGPRYHSLAGSTGLADFAWIVSQGAAFVGPPSGGMHIANAFQTPSVIIFGGYESPAGYYYPFEALYSGVPCAPCWLTTPCPYDRKCLRMIPPEKVFRKVCQVVRIDHVPA